MGNSNRGRKKAELRERVDYDDNNNTRKQYTAAEGIQDEGANSQET